MVREVQAVLTALPGDGPGLPGPPAGPSGAGLFGDLLDRFTEIVGPAASEATFHYASLQEGMRLGAGFGPRDLAAALARVDAVDSFAEIECEIEISLSHSFDPSAVRIHGDTDVLMPPVGDRVFDRFD